MVRSSAQFSSTENGPCMAMMWSREGQDPHIFGDPEPVRKDCAKMRSRKSGSPAKLPVPCSPGGKENRAAILFQTRSRLTTESTTQIQAQKSCLSSCIPQGPALWLFLSLIPLKSADKDCKLRGTALPPVPSPLSRIGMGGIRYKLGCFPQNCRLAASSGLR